MLRIAPDVTLADDELQWQAIRAQGAGGQNVNKVASALHLRLDIRRCSLPERIKRRLLSSSDQRISGDGVLIIKAQRFRTQEKNRADALDRLRQLILRANRTTKKRIPTKPSRASQQRRLDRKAQHGKTKRLRRAPTE